MRVVVLIRGFSSVVRDTEHPSPSSLPHHPFVISESSLARTAMRGLSCGRMSRFITWHTLRKTATLSLKSHRIFWRNLVCNSNALNGVDAVGTRTI